MLSSDKIPRVEEAARHSEAYATNPWALAAWLRKGELDAQHAQCKPFDRDKFLRALLEIRQLTTDEPNMIPPNDFERFVNHDNFTQDAISQFAHNSVLPQELLWVDSNTKASLIGINVVHSKEPSLGIVGPNHDLGILGVMANPGFAEHIFNE